jgi:hypothetical protein
MTTIAGTLARHQWQIVVRGQPRLDPIQALVTVAGTARDIGRSSNWLDTAFARLCAAAAEDLEWVVHCALEHRSHPDSVSLWESCRFLLECVREGWLESAAEYVLATRADAERLSEHADGTCAPAERQALLTWCSQAAEAIRLLRIAQSAATVTRPEAV